MLRLTIAEHASSAALGVPGRARHCRAGGQHRQQVRRAHILAMACGHLQMIATGFRIVRPAPARFRKGLLILGQQRLLAALAVLKGWSIPHVGH